jgi:hypothetical protein
MENGVRSDHPDPGAAEVDAVSESSAIRERFRDLSIRCTGTREKDVGVDRDARFRKTQGQARRRRACQIHAGNAGAGA